MILESIFGTTEYCKPIPRLNDGEAMNLFLSMAFPLNQATLTSSQRKIVKKCFRECQFKDSGSLSLQYHPVVLRVLGTFFRNSLLDMSWEDLYPSKEDGGCLL